MQQARQWLMATPEAFVPILTAVRSLEEADATFQDLEAGRGLKYVMQP